MKTKLLALLALLVLVAPFSASAAVDRAVITGWSTGNNPNPLNVNAAFMDGNTQVEVNNVGFNMSSITDSAGLSDAAVTAVLNYASDQGYTGLNSGNIIWDTYTPDEIDAAIDSAVPDSFLKAGVFTGTVAGGSGAVSIDISSLSCSSVTRVIWEPNDETKVYTFGSKSANTSSASAVVKAQTFSGVTVLGINVLGTVSQANAANGTSVSATVLCS